MREVELRLVIKRHSLILNEVLVDKDIISVGRHSDCDIVLDDPTTSRRAAEFRCQDDGLHIVDLGCIGGIRVGGETVERRRLAPGDEVGIGPFVIQVEGDPELVAASEQTVLLEAGDTLDGVASDKTVLMRPSVEFHLKLPGGEEVELFPGEYVVGRSPECEIELSSDVVSKKHAKITVARGTVVIKDLGSTNGTYVNGQELSQEVEIALGSRVLIGEIPLSLEAPGGVDITAITDPVDFGVDDTGTAFSADFPLATDEQRPQPKSRLRRILLIGIASMVVVVGAILLLTREKMAQPSSTQPTKIKITPETETLTPAELIGQAESTMDAGEVWAAIELWEEALQLDPGNEELVNSYAILMYRVGLVYEGVGEFEDAVMAWRRLVDSVPNSQHPEVVRARTRILRYED